MQDVPCTKSEGGMVPTPHIRCQGEGEEGRAPQGLFYAPKAQMWKVAAQQTNMATAIRTQISLTREERGVEESDLREAVTGYFSSFQPFLAQGFPKTEVVSVHLSCMNFFSDCWSPHQFFGTCIHSWSRHCGCPTSTGLRWEGAPPFCVCWVSSHSLLVFVVEKKKSENPVPVLPGSASMFSTFKGHTQHWGGLWFKLFLFPVSFPK